MRTSMTISSSLSRLMNSITIVKHSITPRHTRRPYSIASSFYIIIFIIKCSISTPNMRKYKTNYFTTAPILLNYLEKGSSDGK